MFKMEIFPVTLDSPLSWTIYLLAVFIAIGSYSVHQRMKNRSNFHTVNWDSYSWTNAKSKQEFTLNCKKLLKEGSEKFTGPFRIITHNGPLILLPASLVDAMNAEKNLSSVEYFKQEFLSEFDTFRTFRPAPPGILNGAIHKGITARLPRLTIPLSSEMTAALADRFGQIDHWKPMDALASANFFITRLANVVFLGQDFSRNQEWVRITSSYTFKLFPAIASLRSFHPWIRPLIDRFSSQTRDIRKDQAVIVSMLTPVIEKRRQEITDAEREGRPPILPNDSLEWFRTHSRGRSYQDIWTQLGLLQVAIQTTSDIMTQAMLHLCAYPEYVEPLRKEICSVLKEHGLSKDALGEMYLLDSFLKESLRLKPVTMASMHRRAMKDVELPGGVKIREGEHLAISSHLMWDSSRYENPDTFDGYRFQRRRQIDGAQNRHMLVSTSVDHLGFAHGKLACPGRFLAAEMLKTATIHLLLKYDLKIESKEEAKWWTYGEMMIPKVGAKVLVRSRQSEVDLDELDLQFPGKE